MRLLEWRARSIPDLPNQHIRPREGMHRSVIMRLSTVLSVIVALTASLSEGHPPYKDVDPALFSDTINGAAGTLEQCK